MNVLILLLAGSSSRLNLEIKKQFYLVKDKPLFMHCFETFYNTNRFDKFVLVITKSDEGIVRNYTSSYLKDDRISFVIGGETRQESVFNALQSLEGKIDDKSNVLIHDAARVLVSSDLIKDVLSELNHEIAVVPAFKLYDSIVKNKNEFILNYEDRDNFKLIQTPQGFKFKEILEAHKLLKEKSFSDDASLIVNLNKKVKLIDGDFINFKVTTKQDLDIAQYILEGRE